MGDLTKSACNNWEIDINSFNSIKEYHELLERTKRQSENADHYEKTVQRHNDERDCFFNTHITQMLQVLSENVLFTRSGTMSESDCKIRQTGSKITRRKDIEISGVELQSVVLSRESFEYKL